MVFDETYPDQGIFHGHYRELAGSFTDDAVAASTDGNGQRSRRYLDRAGVSHMRYEEPRQMSREEAVTLLSGNDGRQRIDALLSLALYDPDWRWVQDQSLSLLHDGDFDVAATAILAL